MSGGFFSGRSASCTLGDSAISDMNNADFIGNRLTIGQSVLS